MTPPYLSLTPTPPPPVRYEGYVAEGLDLGPTFDPEDNTNHRYAYLVPESDWQIMPTLDYYGHEHEDAITGFVAEYDSQIFNR